jgi:hypothetical protein
MLEISITEGFTGSSLIESIVSLLGRNPPLCTSVHS